MARQLTQAALAAKSIRKELKAKFPDTKFSVRSSNFAGGNSVDIAYDMKAENAPSPCDVSVMANRYQYGHFDAMYDIYEYSNHRDDVPQAKYVHVSHSTRV